MVLALGCVWVGAARAPGHGVEWPSGPSPLHAPAWTRTHSGCCVGACACVATSSWGDPWFTLVVVGVSGATHGVTRQPFYTCPIASRVRETPSPPPCYPLRAGAAAGQQPPALCGGVAWRGPQRGRFGTDSAVPRRAGPDAGRAGRRRVTRQVSCVPVQKCIGHIGEPSKRCTALDLTTVNRRPPPARALRVHSLACRVLPFNKPRGAMCAQHSQKRSLLLLYLSR